LNSQFSALDFPEPLVINVRRDEALAHREVAGTAFLVYEVIIVGARCAGSPLAMLLARKGCRVLLVDKALFPSDIISTHAIQPPGVAHLKRWGLLERVLSSNCPPVQNLVFDVGAFALEGSPAHSNDSAMLLCPRRKVLDKILLEAAVSAGVEVRERFCVRDVVREDERITGILGETAKGHVMVERASVVVGADGQRSLIARAVGTFEYGVRPAVSCNYYTYFSGVRAEKIELYNRDRCLIGVIPTNDSLTLVFEAFPNDEFRIHRDRLEQHYFELLAQVPSLFDRIRKGKREARFTGTIDLPGFFRESFGPGWALAGDAGYHKHPITAQGIGDAFRDADQLANAIYQGLSGRVPLEQALENYARRRDETVMPMYEMTSDLATLQPPSEDAQRLFSAMRGNQEVIDQFLGTIAGTVSIPEFYAPENLRRIIGAS
jgi:2-polyprenyl-6-methoxyphenol hydroxylase-like FAD-dependent oxidoreductase